MGSDQDHILTKQTNWIALEFVGNHRPPLPKGLNVVVLFYIRVPANSLREEKKTMILILVSSYFLGLEMIAMSYKMFIRYSEGKMTETLG